MKRCCVCGSFNVKDNADILFIGKSGDYKELCDECSEQMRNIQKNENSQIVSNSLRYFNAKSDNIEDYETKVFIKTMIYSGGENINRPDLYTDNNSYIKENGDSSIWIRGSKYIAWLIFISIIIGGIALGVSMDDSIGFLAFLLSIPIAFVSTAGMMIFLGLAEDIRYIRNNLKR